MKNHMYILECADRSYYTGSTTNLNARLLKHQNGEGANHTRKPLPVKLVYFEEFDRILITDWLHSNFLISKFICLRKERFNTPRSDDASSPFELSLLKKNKL